MTDLPSPSSGARPVAADVAGLRGSTRRDPLCWDWSLRALGEVVPSNLDVSWFCGAAGRSR
jgi:hypothetical protein